MQTDPIQPSEPGTAETALDRPNTHAAETDARDAIRRSSRWGWAVILLGLCGFIAWASVAPLDQGVAAQGVVVVTGNRKAVQSLVAGRVAALNVRDGDRVSAGQRVLELDSVQARSQLDIAHSQWLTALATEARLAAEQVNRDAIEYPPALRQAALDDPRAAGAMQLQTQLFGSRRAALAGDITVLQMTIAGLEGQATSLEQLRASRLEQQKSLAEEGTRLQALAGKGYYPANRVAEQERAQTQISGMLAEEAGTALRIRQGAAEARARIANRRNEHLKEVTTQRADVRREIQALASRIEALRYEVQNTLIRAPATGIVVGLNVFTVGGVIQPGVMLMEIVPENETLRIEAQIPTLLVDKIHAGLRVDVHFPALLRADTPRIPGTLTAVSADALVDLVSKLPYYKAQVEITAEGMSALDTFTIKPGMPAEAFIRTGERTLANYIFKPLRDRFRPALTEQ